MGVMVMNRGKGGTHCNALRMWVAKEALLLHKAK